MIFNFAEMPVNASLGVYLRSGNTEEEVLNNPWGIHFNIDTSGFTAYSSAGVTFKAENMPGAVAFYGGRLAFGGTTGRR